MVATVRECCEANEVAVPTLVSESGRAIASHFSLLVFDVLGNSKLPASVPDPTAEEPLTVRNLRETLATIQAVSNNSEPHLVSLQEAWNDALKFKQDALAAFRLGYMGLRDRATAEQLTWTCAEAIAARLPHDQTVPEELSALRGALAGTYYANLSIFRSAPDTWAIDQLFPVLPIQRLDQQPTRLANLADLTCDSDGRLDRFIGDGQAKPLLELHELTENEPYLIALFLSGAYQEVMGNLHNLFGTTNAVHIRLSPGGSYRVDHVVRGDTNADVLEAMEHDPRSLLERLRMAAEAAISNGQLRIDESRRLMDHLESSLRQTTYLQD